MDTIRPIPFFQLRVLPVPLQWKSMEVPGGYYQRLRRNEDLNGREQNEFGPNDVQLILKGGIEIDRF